MKRLLSLSLLLIFMTACGKKEESLKTSSSAPQKAEAATTMPVAPTNYPSYSDEPDPSFTIPKPARKQSKYYPEGSALREIQDLDDMLDSYVLDPKTPEDLKYNDNLKKAVIHGTFDIRELCQMALGKHWAERTPQEQDQFVNLMIRLLEKKAIFSKEQGQKKKSSGSTYKVSYLAEEFIGTDKAKAIAKTTVSIPSQKLNIDLDYKLKKNGNRWRVYDIIVDSASLLENYKFQFDKIINKEGYPSLVQRMEKKLEEINKKPASTDVTP